MPLPGVFALYSHLGTVILEGPKSLESVGGQEKGPRDLLSRGIG